MKSPNWRTTVRVAWNDTSRAALISLLVTNAIPLVGVLLGRWSLFSVMFLYWAENGVTGAYNAVKIGMARGGGSDSDLLTRLPLVVFFWFHYGLFWVVHGVFVFVLFGSGFGGGGFFNSSFRGFGSRSLFTLPNLDAEFSGGVWAMVGLLAISHGISFVNNFIGRDEYQRISPQEQMMQPYQRVILLHVTVLAGGFVVLLLGQPLPALVLLVLLKTGVDLRAHVTEHSKVRG